MRFTTNSVLFSGPHYQYKILPLLLYYLKHSFYIMILVFFCESSLLMGQPSGGPYGPINKYYELPKTNNKIYFVAPDGNKEASGIHVDQPTTIEKALTISETGDFIILRGGTYRTGNLVFNQGITLQAYADEHPVLKGTFIATNWEQQENGLWVTTWHHLFPSRPQSWWRRYRHGQNTPMHRFNNDMVFVDGRFLQSAGWEGELDNNSFYIDYETGLVYLSIDPTDKLVEITAHDVALHRVIEVCNGRSSDSIGPDIRGIKFTQYADRAIEIDGNEPMGLSDESNHGKDVVGTLLENCEISYCSRVGALLRGDSLKILNCKVSNISIEGIYIIGSSDVLLENNLFTKFNIENISEYYATAVKIFNQSYRVTCKNNMITDIINACGIWYDVGNVDGVFINNWIEGVGDISREFHDDRVWPSDNGFYFEISKGVICAGNVFVNCDHGLCIYNSSDAKIYNNTFLNSMVVFGRTARGDNVDHFGWHPTTGPRVEERDGHIFINNLLTADKNFQKPLLFVWDTLCGRIHSPHFNKLDNNIYIRESEENKYPLILWSPFENVKCQQGFELKEFRSTYHQFSQSGKYFTLSKSEVFTEPDSGNFRLLKTFPGSDVAISMPDYIRNILGIDKKHSKYLGAY
jgi:parallel beta-helix repeat protein